LIRLVLNGDEHIKPMDRANSKTGHERNQHFDIEAKKYAEASYELEKTISIESQQFRIGRVIAPEAGQTYELSVGIGKTWIEDVKSGNVDPTRLHGRLDPAPEGETWRSHSHHIHHRLSYADKNYSLATESPLSAIGPKATSTVTPEPGGRVAIVEIPGQERSVFPPQAKRLYHQSRFFH